MGRGPHSGTGGTSKLGYAEASRRNDGQGANHSPPRLLPRRDARPSAATTARAHGIASTSPRGDSVAKTRDVNRTPQQKLRIADQIAPPLVGLLQRELHLLEAVASYPAGCAFQCSAPVVE